MSAASDRLAALTGASFENGLHRTALPAAFNDVATVGEEVAGTAYNLEAAVAAQDAAAASAVAASASASAAAATIPAALDRTVGRRANDTSIWTMVRSTPAWGFNSKGEFEETAIDTIRWEFDPATRAPLGAAFAGTRANVVTNPYAEGAVAATPGTVPTGWGTRPSGAPTIEIVGNTTLNGVAGVLAKFSGVPTSTSGQSWILSASTAITSGWIVPTEAYVALVAGTLTNLGAFTFRANSGSDSGTTFVPGAFARVQRLWTSTTTAAQPAIRWSYNDTVTPVDFTLFIGGIHQEVNVPFISAPIRPPVGTPGASTRAQGTVSIPVRDLGSRYNYRQGVLIVEWNSQPGAFTSAADTDFFGIVSLGDLGANEVMGLVINAAHTAALFRRTVGGSPKTTATLSITPPAAGETVRFAMAWDADAGLMQVAARGAAGVQLTGETTTPLPIITHLMPGRFSTTRPLFGRINGLEIRPAAVWGSTLAALT